MTAEGPVTLALVGAGERGARVYGAWVREHPEEARLVAVAEPDPERRARVAREHGIPAERCFASGEELLDAPRLADGLILATPDRAHAAPARRAVRQRYHLLLEKPVAVDRGELLELRQALRTRTSTVTVCHVLRHTEFFSTLKRLVDEGRIGRLLSIDHLENVGFWHYAHSYVRGNWRRRDDAAPFLLAKSCHDLDLLRWFAGGPCVRLSSVGSLSWFRAENAPPGATDRCTDGCAVERECPYSAVRFYLEEHGDVEHWPVTALGEDLSPAGRRRALEEGPYGRCVYRSDNDVVDHQVVALEFAGGVTASLTVTAFTAENTRTVKLMGSHGELRGHMARGEVELRDFRTGEREVFPLAPEGRGHIGGDRNLMRDWVARLHRLRAGEDPGQAATDFEEALESHLLAFAADDARCEARVVSPPVQRLA